ncbi:MAG: hypothetical protein BWX50_01315 [Euryarchaeota archaeon ADurb.Bin009]|nr:MAG: hypothetical protein BWX50_01315 [Euryarchaeota archaeon ADurb.Bin009]
MLFDKLNSMLDGDRQMFMNLSMVEDSALCRACKTPALYPGIGKMPLPISSEKQHPANGRDKPPLYRCEQFQCKQFLLVQLSLPCKERPCSRQIQRIYCQFWQG